MFGSPKNVVRICNTLAQRIPALFFQVTFEQCDKQQPQVNNGLLFTTMLLDGGH